jgi:hypothetical protein
MCEGRKEGDGGRNYKTHRVDGRVVVLLGSVKRHFSCYDAIAAALHSQGRHQCLCHKRGEFVGNAVRAAMIGTWIRVIRASDTGGSTVLGGLVACSFASRGGLCALAGEFVLVDE